MNDLRVKEVLKERRLSQKALAGKIGVAEISLSRSINGNPSLDTFQKIATALSVPVSELFEQPKQNVVTCPNCGTLLKIEKV